MTPRPPDVVPRPGARGRTFTYIAWASGFALGMALLGPVRRIAASVTLLTELGSKDAPLPQVTASNLTVTEGATRFRARLYLPTAQVRRCAVVGHGVHWKGIDEPRLQNFAARLAARGVAILTPELAELADYRITRQSADVLSAAVRHLSVQCGGEPVGLIGFSFAGGLALLAATDPAVNTHLAYVTSVGGYDDLSRELTFLLTDHVQTPQGLVPRKAHEYGLIVLLYEHLEALVPEEDFETMHLAVRAWLREERARAWTFASLRTTERAERVFMELATGHRDEFRRQLAPILAASGSEEQALSPTGRLGRIPVPVYLLHGQGDSVIPPEETVWAGRELGAQPHLALVTPLIEHVEISGAPTLSEQWALVRFMAHLL
jgi:pimeloyl-ACP methyl ester carboxylesterase